MTDTLTARFDPKPGQPYGSCETCGVELATHADAADLMCFCPLDQPCHADVLLELANREGE